MQSVPFLRQKVYVATLGNQERPALTDREGFSGKAYISLIYSTRGKQYVLGEYSGKLTDYAEFT